MKLQSYKIILSFYKKEEAVEIFNHFKFYFVIGFKLSITMWILFNHFIKVNYLPINS